MTYYVCRLVTPRPTFPADITADERMAMGEHGAYWRSLLPTGKVVIVGPVADPARAYGLGIVQADSLDEVSALLDADPIIAADMGFHYETAPMMSAIVP
jgi:hypothetical protein